MIYHETPSGTLYQGEVLDILRTLQDESINCCVTSPPYWGLRDYGVDGQLGLERTPEEYVARMVEIFREVRRVLRKDGTLWLNLGDSYNGSGGAGGDYNAGGIKEGQPKYAGRNDTSLKPKDLVGIPWRVAFALQADGWYLRQDIIWHKHNPMPESVTDRCTKAHEYVFLMSNSAKYYFDNEAIKEKSTSETRERKRPNGLSVEEGKKLGAYNHNCGVTATRNRRSVWTVTTKPFKGAHFATFPRDLIRPMIQAGCPAGGVVLDPFMGSGTTAIEAIYQNKRYIGIDLNPEYCAMAAKRIEVELDQTDLFRKEQ